MIFDFFGSIDQHHPDDSLAYDNIVSWHAYDGGFWLRIGNRGRGFAVVNKSKNPPLFSERYGYRKVYRIGKWGFEILKPANDGGKPSRQL